MTVGAVYALVALGFTIIYNASDVVNFAQGEFVMLGGMITVFANMAGLPLPLAALIAIAATAAVGVALNKLAIEPARGAPVVSLIIITIGASIFIRGVAQLVFDKQLHRFPAFSGDTPIQILGATILPQSLWVLAGAIAVFVGLWLFFTRTLTGRAVLATSNNRLAAQLVGINTNWVMTLSFALSAAIGALAGRPRHPDHQHQLRRRHRARAQGLRRRHARRHGQPDRRAGRRHPPRPHRGADRRLHLARSTRTPPPSSSSSSSSS